MAPAGPRPDRRLGGWVAIYLCLVGIVTVFNDGHYRQGHLARPAGPAVASASAVPRSTLLHPDSGPAVVAGTRVGAILGAFLTGLVLVGSVVDLRAVFLNASPDLYRLLTTGWDRRRLVPDRRRDRSPAACRRRDRLPPGRGPAPVEPRHRWSSSACSPACCARRCWTSRLGRAGPFLLGTEGLTGPARRRVLRDVRHRGPRPGDQAQAARRRPADSPASPRRRSGDPPPRRGPVLPAPAGAVLRAGRRPRRPLVLLGLGLNITLGLAGLLDLGFVAFYAVGAYTVALLTSTAEFGIAGLTFWQAVPIAVLVAMLFGDLPWPADPAHPRRLPGDRHPRLRRDHPDPGGVRPAQAGPGRTAGHHQHPQADRGAADALPGRAGPDLLHRPRLRRGRGLRGLAPARRPASAERGWPCARTRTWPRPWASTSSRRSCWPTCWAAASPDWRAPSRPALVGSVFASSIQLQLSINVVAIVIVGGMGSIPGVIVGALVLIGLPELFREFADYRLLFYGIALMAIMIVRPEGLCRRGSPSGAARRGGRSSRADEAAGIAGQLPSRDAAGSTGPRDAEGAMSPAEGRAGHQAVRRPGRGQQARLRARGRAPSPASSARTAPARRPSSTASPASTTWTRARITFDGDADPRAAARTRSPTSASRGPTRTSGCSRP